LEAIILAGGLGTRLKGVVNDLPKSMASVNGHPFLEYMLNYLLGQGIRRIILSVGYKGDVIQSYFKDHYKGMMISYAIEEEPLGTGGGIKNAFKQVENNRAFTLNGDSLFRIDFQGMLRTHSASNADLTLALRYLEDTGRFGTVQVSNEKRITGFMEKDPDSGPGYINGGVYLINKDFIEKEDFPQIFSMEKDCFEKYYQKARIFAYISKGYFLDIGIPEDYQKAQDDFKEFED
jgi:D-glycero-alpha-D-manno-heptose 1-phosphate guanylyltransferase